MKKEKTITLQEEKEMKGKKEFYAFMKESREQLNYTQEEAAEKIGVSTTTIQNWEGGVKAVIPSRPIDLQRIIEVYNLDEFRFKEMYSQAVFEFLDTLDKDKINYPFLPDKLMHFTLSKEEIDILYMMNECKGSSKCFNAKYDSEKFFSFK